MCFRTRHYCDFNFFQVLFSGIKCLSILFISIFFSFNISDFSVFYCDRSRWKLIHLERKIWLLALLDILWVVQVCHQKLQKQKHWRWWGFRTHRKGVVLQSRTLCERKIKHAHHLACIMFLFRFFGEVHRFYNRFNNPEL